MSVWKEELGGEETRVTVGKPMKPQSQGLEGDRSLGFCSRGNERLTGAGAGEWPDHTEPFEAR